MERQTTKEYSKQASLFLGLLILFACTNRTLYNQYQVIDPVEWSKDREYFFTFHIDDITVPYNITFEVRNNNLYPYQNLWIFYTEEPPVGDIRRDTLECQLADEYGKWYGDGISLYQSGFPIRSHYYFPLKGQYTFSFRQGMRNDKLRGIQEIGLRIEQTLPPNDTH
jgi:gliding motility-associated lipoprotein GldH